VRAFAVAENSSTITELELPTPRPARSEVLLRVTQSGVCHTDTHLRDGGYDLGSRQYSCRSMPQMPLTRRNLKRQPKTETHRDGPADDVGGVVAEGSRSVAILGCGRIALEDYVTAAWSLLITMWLMTKRRPRNATKKRLPERCSAALRRRACSRSKHRREVNDDSKQRGHFWCAGHATAVSG
jgi:hypothetical protein